MQVTELKNQLQASNMSTADSVLEDDMESTVMGSTTSRRRTANDAHREQIKQMDRERKENQEVCLLGNGIMHKMWQWCPFPRMYKYQLKDCLMIYESHKTHLYFITICLITC